MSVKTITQANGRAFRLGRTRPAPHAPRLLFRDYLKASLAPPPASVDYTARGKPFLSEILGNDRLGDCTAAGAFHIGGALLGSAGMPIPFTEADAIAFYSATTGYNPADPLSDQGGDEATVLNYWRASGLTPGAHRIAGWMAVDGTNADEVRQALFLFENNYFGVELPDGWVNPMPSGDGFVWDVVGDPDPGNGHCFVGLGYDVAGVTIDSWGMLGKITWSAIAKYAAGGGGGELYTVISQDALATAALKAPNGLDWAQLTADFAAMGGALASAILADSSAAAATIADLAKADGLVPPAKTTTPDPPVDAIPAARMCGRQPCR